MTDRELIAEARSYLANNDGSSFYYGKDVITRTAYSGVPVEGVLADRLRVLADEAGGAG